MNIPLVERPVKRLFAFGCSFTRYMWTNWPEIIANHLDVPHWNFGRSGGGNQFMFTRLMQAKQIYDIGPDDLVIICWTNFSREDRWCDQIEDWELGGNIYSSNGIWDEKWIKRWSNSVHYALRDLSIISATRYCLESWNCQWHFLSMCDLIDNIDETKGHQIPKNFKSKLIQTYEKDLNLLLPSYYNLLWKNDLLMKSRLEKQEVHPRFRDGHPSPAEHYHYLSSIWPELKETQSEAVRQVHNNYKNYLRTLYNDGRKFTGKSGVAFPSTYLSVEERDHLLKLTTIRSSEFLAEELL